MKVISILSVFLLLTSLRCKREAPGIIKDENGVIISMPYLWKKSLHNNLGFHSNSTFDVPVSYNGNIAIPTTNGENVRQMTLIDPDNGESIWSWDDRFQPATERIYLFYAYQYNNLLTYQNGDRSYCINMDNGTTYWKYRRNSPYFDIISGLEDTYFVMGESVSRYAQYHERVVFKGNMQTGALEEFIVPDFTLNHIAPGNRIGDVTGVVPYRKNGVQYLAVIWQEPQNVTSINDWQTYLGLYNYDTNQWVYEKSVVNQPNINGVLLAPPVIYNDKIYLNVGKELFCHDLMTGDQIWSRQFYQDFMFSGFIIAEDKIIANNEDTYTYCLDPGTGDIIWKTETAGTSSRISYLNGIVYFVGGSTGRLHALDINTGRHVWKLQSDLLDPEDVYSFKTNAVYVIPARNGKPPRVIALTHLYAYCFEAYR